MSNYKRLDESSIHRLSELMSIQGMSLAAAARDIGFDPSGIRKAILAYRTLDEKDGERGTNHCGKRRTCTKANVCPGCRFGGNRQCRTCKKGCNELCPSFDKRPDCERLLKFPYCCNGCPNTHCRLLKWRFNPRDVWLRMSGKRSSSRSAARRSGEELARIASIVVPLVKEKGQSISQIAMTHGRELGVSAQTIYTYVRKKLIPGLISLDLRKAVKYKPRSKKAAKPGQGERNERLDGRTYDDFVAAVAAEPTQDVIQMDTVAGRRGSEACLLTLLSSKTNFMLAFLLPEKTAEAVAAAFASIRERLGAETYRRTFSAILTDNGPEFLDPLSIEVDPSTGEKLASVYYCEPGKSGQKGKIEKNHVELRKIFPKGADFGRFSQAQVDEALRNVNSEPRRLLNGNAPGRIAPAFLDEKVLALNEYRFLAPDSVNLTPRAVEH